MTDYEDDYIEPAETCEWLLGLEAGCSMDSTEYMCSECPNLTSEHNRRREEAYRKFLRLLASESA